MSTLRSTFACPAASALGSRSSGIRIRPLVRRGSACLSVALQMHRVVLIRRTRSVPWHAWHAAGLLDFVCLGITVPLDVWLPSSRLRQRGWLQRRTIVPWHPRCRVFLISAHVSQLGDSRTDCRRTTRKCGSGSCTDRPRAPHCAFYRIARFCDLKSLSSRRARRCWSPAALPVGAKQSQLRPMVE